MQLGFASEVVSEEEEDASTPRTRSAVQLTRNQLGQSCYRSVLIYMYIYICIHIHIYIIYVYIYNFIYIHIYVYVYTPTHTHTRLLK